MASSPASILMQVGAVKAKRPNIIFFIVDDMGWQDTSVPFYSQVTPFNRRYRTPNMEKLASEGVKFTQAYACTVCSPTRVSILTGLNAGRHRVTNWIHHKNKSTDHDHPRLSFPEWNVNGLSPEPGIERTIFATPLPALLKDAGYRTIMVGKAHFSAIGTPGEDPKALGFEVNIGGHSAGQPGSYLGEQNYGNQKGQYTKPMGVPNLEEYHGTDVFLTEALTRKANGEIDRAVSENKPFFLYMANYAVHTPIMADKRFMQNYENQDLPKVEKEYATLVEGMDKSLGDLMANLKKHGIDRDTVIIFISDNGGLSAYDRSPPMHTHNKPLSSGKGSAHEGGVRVPMIVKWPGVVRGGLKCDRCVTVEDFFPTILEIAGIRQYTQTAGKVDGLSLVPLFKGSGEYPKARPIFWHYPNCWGPTGPGIGPHSAVRLGDWKLIYYHDGPKYELFNLAQDIGEENNLADKNTAKRNELAKILGAWLKEADALMPVNKASGQPVPLPES